MFVTINAKHTRLNPSHLVSLSGRQLYRDENLAAAHDVVRALSEREDSPLFGEIKLLGVGHGRVAQAPLAQELKKLFATEAFGAGRKGDDFRDEAEEVLRELLPAGGGGVRRRLERPQVQHQVGVGASRVHPRRAGHRPAPRSAARRSRGLPGHRPHHRAVGPPHRRPPVRNRRRLEALGLDGRSARQGAPARACSTPKARWSRAKADPRQCAVHALGIDTGGHVHRFRPPGAGRPRSFTSSAPHPTIPRARSSKASAHLIGDDADADVVHGSTVATNAVLERKGARVALVATAGFEDVLQIGRQTRPELYNIFVAPRPPLVDPSLTFGVTERLDAVRRACCRRSTTTEVDRLRAADRTTAAPTMRGRVPAALVRESRTRAAARQRCCARRPRGLHLARSAARVPRVRALEHDGRQRVRDAADGSVSRRRSKRTLTGMRGCRSCSRTAARFLRAPRARRRFAPCCPGRPPALSARSAVAARRRIPARHLVRHGRHVHRRQSD